MANTEQCQATGARVARAVPATAEQQLMCRVCHAPPSQELPGSACPQHRLSPHSGSRRPEQTSYWVANMG